MNSIKKKNIGENSLDHLSESTYWHLSQYVTYGKFMWEVQNLRVVSRLLYSLKLNRQLPFSGFSGEGEPRGGPPSSILCVWNSA